MPEHIQPDPSITILQPKPKPPLKAPSILIAISIVLIILGIGLCSAGGINFEHDSAHPIIVGFGSVAFWGGILGLGVGVLWWLVALITRPRKEMLPHD